MFDCSIVERLLIGLDHGSHATMPAGIPSDLDCALLFHSAMEFLFYFDDQLPSMRPMILKGSTLGHTRQESCPYWVLWFGGGLTTGSRSHRPWPYLRRHDFATYSTIRALSTDQFFTIHGSIVSSDVKLKLTHALERDAWNQHNLN